MRPHIVWVQEVIINGDLERVAVFSSKEQADDWFEAYVSMLDVDPVTGTLDAQGLLYSEVVDDPAAGETGFGSC